MPDIESDRSAGTGQIAVPRKMARQCIKWVGSELGPVWRWGGLAKPIARND
jgi:hypothetical protein